MQPRTTTSELVNKGNKNHIFVTLPRYWEKGIKLAHREHIQATDEKVSFNGFIKRILTEIANSNINPFDSDFNYCDHVKPFLSKKNKWKSISFKQKERLDISKGIDCLERKTKSIVQINHYILACLWDAMPFLEDLFEEKRDGKKR